MNRREFLATGAATLGTALAGCASGGGLGYDVGMVSMAFVPSSTVEVSDDAPEWISPDDPTIRVKVGDTVVWENTGSRIHTVTAATHQHRQAEKMIAPTEEIEDREDPVPQMPEGSDFFASGDFDNEIDAVKNFFEDVSGGGAVPPGKQYAHTFRTPGWYHYYCIPHETAGMKGNVHVLEG